MYALARASFCQHPLATRASTRARRSARSASSGDRYDVRRSGVCAARRPNIAVGANYEREKVRACEPRQRSLGSFARAPQRGVAPRASSGGLAGAPLSGAPNPLDTFRNGLKDRLEVDPNFLFKLGAEISIDFVITVMVNIAVRGNPTTWAFTAALAVLCQVITAFINDTVLVYFLAPTKASLGKKPEIANIFAKGDYTLSQRITCYLKKGKFYAMIGAVSCAISMFLALSLAGNLRQFNQEVFFRSIACGALHLGVSSNTRYQLVNGIERLAFDLLPTNIAKGMSVSVRMGNNFLGARLWMVVASLTGLS